MFLLCSFMGCAFLWITFSFAYLFWQFFNNMTHCHNGQFIWIIFHKSRVRSQLSCPFNHPSQPHINSNTLIPSSLNNPQAWRIGKLFDFHNEGRGFNSCRPLYFITCHIFKTNLNKLISILINKSYGWCNGKCVWLV